MKQNEILHGFLVRKATHLSEQKAVLYRLEYLKNGAELIFLDNKESNKLFSIAFQTLPEDDTGVFHILEHAVLCGSEKYPVKEPFLDLMKGSMKTFLNAFTFPDKTVFPISSRNETDFLNLMQVYLDAVFSPNISENPSIFYQEGWHCEPESEISLPSFQGVVFSEMKGAFSSAQTLIGTGLNRLLFPDACYRFVSGGDPRSIPDLTYGQFLAAHKKFYHPSNAKFYLDGDVPLDQVLSILDREYLSHYDRENVLPALTLQQPPPCAESIAYYGIGAEEECAGNTYIAFGKLLCDYSDRKKLLALMALGAYLTGTNDAPLKRAILGRGLAQDVTLSVMDGIAQPYCYFQISNTAYENGAPIKAALREAAEAVLQGGLDRGALYAALDQLEFQIREREEPQGLARNLDVLSAWMYGGEPTLYLENDGLFAALRAAVETGYYEALLREILPDEMHTATLYLLPSKTKQEEDRQWECRQAAKRMADLSPQAVLEANRQLQAWQTTPDTKEALDTLPALSLSDVGEMPTPLSTEHLRLGTVPVLFHPAACSGIVHFNLYFALADCSPEALQKLSFLTNLLGLLPTSRYSVSQLQLELNRKIGFLDFNLVSYGVPGQPERCRPYFSVSCSTLEANLGDAIELLFEILSATSWAESAQLIHEILLQCCDGMRQDLLENGHQFALRRAAAHFSADGVIREQVEGYEFYRFLTSFAENFDNEMEDFLLCARASCRTVFSADRMTLSVTYDRLCPAFDALSNRLNPGNPLPEPGYLTVMPERAPAKELIRIPSGVSFAAGANHVSCYGIPYSGSLQVLASILTYAYLWEEVRVKGGAYGCGFQVGLSGSLGFYSYRDPAPLQSLQAYQAAAQFLRAFCARDDRIDHYIISTIAAAEPLEGLRAQGLRADADVFCGVSPEDRLRIREEMLRTTKDDLLSYGDFLEAAAGESTLCILGDADAAQGLYR